MLMVRPGGKCPYALSHLVPANHTTPGKPFHAYYIPSMDIPRNANKASLKRRAHTSPWGSFLNGIAGSRGSAFFNVADRRLDQFP